MSTKKKEKKTRRKHDDDDFEPNQGGQKRDGLVKAGVKGSTGITLDVDISTPEASILFQALVRKVLYLFYFVFDILG